MSVMGGFVDMFTPIQSWRSVAIAVASCGVEGFLLFFSPFFLTIRPAFLNYTISHLEIRWASSKRPLGQG